MRIQEEKAPRATHLLLYRPCMMLIFAVLLSMPSHTQASLATSNVIHRTFHIYWGKFTGTAFAIDHAAKQYLVTARHVVEGIKSGNVIKIHHEREWKDFPVNVVGIGKGRIDVAVLACSVQLAPSLPLIASDKGLQLGHSISFLGFPFGWEGGGEQLNRGFPLPLVKAGIVSMLSIGDMPNIYLDAHGNKGFSGGPVVFAPNGQPGEELSVAAIVSNYPVPLLQPIVDRKGDPFTNPAGEAIGYIRENPGIVAAIPIRYAVELIDANPIGFPLPAE